MWVNEGTPTISFVLYSINVECMCDTSYITWKYRQYIYIRYHVIFARKYYTFQNMNTSWTSFNRNGTPSFIHFEFYFRRRWWNIFDCNCLNNKKLICLLYPSVFTWGGFTYVLLKLFRHKGEFLITIPICV